MLNRVVLVGRLTRDPELRVSQSNIPVGTFNLAVNRPFTNQQGERGADFINCVVFRKQAENVSQFLSKGSLVGVDGRLQSRSYENKDGQTVYVTEVVCDSVQFLESKSQDNTSQSENEQSNTNTYSERKTSQNEQYFQSSMDLKQNQGNAYNRSHSNDPIDISDTDLPF